MHKRACLVLLALVVAGCTGGDDGGVTPPAGDPTTGSIRGIVVDQAIVPVAGVIVTISGGANTTTNDVGEFRFDDLEPGEYIVTAGRAGYKGSQTNAQVTAGDIDPPLVKLLVERIATATPYLDHYKLEGYYECAFSYGNEGRPFITDSCDMAWRTAWDAANETGNPPPIPRTPTKSINTQFIDLSDDTFSVVQEAFWDDENVPVMMVLLSSTPIDNACDCSETDYIDVTQPSPTYGRIDRYNETGEIKGFPINQHLAARGFLSWESTATAQQFSFVLITTVFHNYVPDPAWTFETKDNYPIG